MKPTQGKPRSRPRRRRSRDGLYFDQLREALIRTAYFETFAPLLPAKLVPHFQRHARDGALDDLVASVLSHLSATRGRRIA